MENLKNDYDYKICPVFYSKHVLRQSKIFMTDSFIIHPMTVRDYFYTNSLVTIIQCYIKILLLIKLNLYLELKILQSQKHKRYVKFFHLTEKIPDLLTKWRKILNV